MSLQRDAELISEPPVAPRPQDRRFVYNGEVSAPGTEDRLPRFNRPVKRRKRSPFNIIAALVVVSVLIVFYVWNKIAVNRLAIEVNDLQSQYQKTENANDLLRAEITKKSSLERIGKIAAQIGLTYPREQPTWLEVDGDKLQELQSQ
jgi:cell division protein FtsL